METTKDEEVRAQILEAAKRVFQKWGLNKTTMEDIAQEVGKGKSTLYYYFKSKDEIFESLAIIEMNNIHKVALDSIRGLNSPKEKIRSYITIMLKEVKKTISIYPLVKGEIKGNAVLIGKCSKILDTNEENTIKEILLEGIKTGEFSVLRENQIDKAANVIIAILRGLGLYLFFDNEDEEKIDIITKLIANGI